MKCWGQKLDPSAMRMLDCEVSGPAVIADLQRLGERLGHRMSGWEQAGIRVALPWAELGRREVVEVVAAFTGGGWPEFAVAGDVSDAELLVSAGCPRVLVDRAPFGTFAWSRLAELARVAEITVVVDHYLQAECWQAALERASAVMGFRGRLLIGVNLGRNEYGVRPGVDTVELAWGVSRFGRLQFEGLWGQLPDFVRPGEEPGAEAVFRLLADLERQCHSRGVVCDRLVVQVAPEILTSATVAADGHLTSGQPPKVVWALSAFPQVGNANSVGDRALSANASVAIGLPGDGANGPAVSQSMDCGLLARVISRPHLDRAVVGLGARFRGALDDASPVSEWPEIRVQSRGLSDCTLELGESVRDLQIGDWVVLQTREPGDLWRSSLPLVDVGSGLVRRVIPPPSGR